MRRGLLLVVLVAFLGLAAASVNICAGNLFGLFERTVKGSGDLVTQERALPPFDRIKSSGACDIEVVIGSPQVVKLTFDDNLIDLIETDVDDGTLEIWSDKPYSSRHNCRVEITVDSLSAVSSSGSGDIHVEGLKAHDFEFHLSGSGDFYFQGKSEEINVDISGSGDGFLEGETGFLDIHVSGSGDIDARQLVADEAEVSVSGSGDVKVFASGSFDGSVSGSGDIVYYGDPEHVSRHVSGSGDIRKR